MANLSKKGKVWGKIKRRLSRRLYLTRFIFFSSVIGVIILGLNFLLPSSLKLFKGLFKESLFLTSYSPEDLKSSRGRVNLLLLGAGGSNHKGEDLTDTIIFFSVDIEGRDVLMFSLPRDIWIPSIRAKINTAYHYGEEKRPGGGLLLAKAAVNEILNQPVHYAVLVDFDGFVKAIDLLGGVEIEVERTFDDYKYPIPGMEEAEPEELRYEHLHFDAGSQVMNGERALKYVRSRFAEGEEGTDFARSKRQQHLILSLKKKIFSTKTLLNPQKIPELVKIFKDRVDTDISQEEYPTFFKLALKFEQGNLYSEVLNGGAEGEEGYLVNPPKSKKYDQQWVLVPRTGDWQEIQEHVASLIEK
jgi:LCP family protein required for cell wall assembly